MWNTFTEGPSLVERGPRPPERETEKTPTAAIIAYLLTFGISDAETGKIVSYVSIPGIASEEECQYLAGQILIRDDRKFACHAYKMAAVSQDQPTEASPANPPASASLIGSGGAICQTYLEEKKAQPGYATIHFWAWAEGFMSAMNLARSAAGKPVRNLTPVATHRNPTEFLDTYCREHPLEGWVVGVETLYSSLPESRVGGADGSRP